MLSQEDSEKVKAVRKVGSEPLYTTPTPQPPDDATWREARELEVLPPRIFRLLHGLMIPCLFVPVLCSCAFL